MKEEMTFIDYLDLLPPPEKDYDELIKMNGEQSVKFFLSQEYQLFLLHMNGYSGELYEKNLISEGFKSFDDGNYENALNFLFNQLFIYQKYFSYTKEVKEMMLQTNNNIFPRKLPFKMFILDGLGELEPNYLNKAILVFSHKSGGFVFSTIDCIVPHTLEYQVKVEMLYQEAQIIDDKSFKKLSIKDRRIALAICNFLDFLNHPFAVHTIQQMSKLNTSRMKKGKTPLCDIVNISSHSLINNVNLTQTKKSDLSYSFWVRGHFRHFRNKKRFQKLYSLNKEELKEKDLFENGGFISRWIPPTIKGTGKLIEKERRLKWTED